MTGHELTIESRADAGTELLQGVCSCGSWLSRQCVLRFSIARDHEQHLRDNGETIEPSYLRKVVMGW